MGPPSVTEGGVLGGWVPESFPGRRPGQLVWICICGLCCGVGTAPRGSLRLLLPNRKALFARNERDSCMQGRGYFKR